MSTEWRVVRYKDGSGYGLHQVNYDNEGLPYGMSAQPVVLQVPDILGPHRIMQIMREIIQSLGNEQMVVIFNEPEAWPGIAP